MSSASESESSCMNLESGCDGDERDNEGGPWFELKILTVEVGWENPCKWSESELEKTT